MRFFLLFLTFVLTACATQTHQPGSHEISEAEKEAWVVETKKWLHDVNKLESIAFRVLTKGIDYCTDQEHTAPYLGARFWSSQPLQPAWRKVASEKFNLGNEPQIHWVVPSSPADVAGLEVKDKIKEVNGVSVQSVPDTLEKVKEASASGNQITFTIERAGDQKMIAVTPTMACKSRVVLVDNNSLNTGADGELIHITRGLLNFARSDEEVAVIVSHQLAHNARKHQRNNKIAGTLGGIVGGIMGGAADVALGIATGGVFFTGVFTEMGWSAGSAMAGSTSTSQLQQADRDSVQLMSLAGYQVDSVSEFWQRVKEYDLPDNLNGLRNSHPFSQDRFVAMEAMQKEVKEKYQNHNSSYSLNF